MKYIFYTLIALTIVLSTFILGYTWTDTAMRYAPQENTKRVHRAVYTICNYSNKTYSGEAEELCGEVQYATGTEFTCTEGICTVTEKKL